MALTFLPSLQHLASVRSAMMAYNDDIVQFLDELYLREEYKVLDPHHFSEREDEWILNRMNKARVKLGDLISPLLHESVAQLLQPIIHQIHFWVRDHFHIIKHIEKIHYKNCLCWKTDGTLDREKTTRLIVKNENIDKRVRFAMSCIYFLQNDIYNLWQSMTNYERISIFEIDSNIAIGFWVERLSRGAEKSPSATMLRSYLCHHISNCSASTSRIRLSSLFNASPSLDKIDYLNKYWPQRVHSDDIRLCYKMLDATQRAKLMRMTTFQKDLLLGYLDWPFQSLFIAAIKQTQNHLSSCVFSEGLEYIVFKKLMRRVEDFDYLELLKDLWNQIQDIYKCKIKRQAIFSFVHAAVNYDVKKDKRPIQAILRELLYKDE